MALAVSDDVVKYRKVKKCSVVSVNDWVKLEARMNKTVSAEIKEQSKDTEVLEALRELQCINFSFSAVF